MNSEIAERLFLDLEIVRALEAAHLSVERAGDPVELGEDGGFRYGEYVGSAATQADGGRSRETFPSHGARATARSLAYLLRGRTSVEQCMVKMCQAGDS
jgi:hypothetical protein